MSTNANAETETAETTEAAVETSAPEIPGRNEVLMEFAREAMGEPEAAAPPAKAGTENADAKALSQSEPTETENANAEAEAETEPPAETGTEENHLEDDLRQALPEDVQEAINRRIGKEVAKTKVEREQREVLETRVQELEAQLASAPRPQPQNVPLSDVHDAVLLQTKRQEAEQALEQADDLLLTLEDDPAAVERALRASKVELKDAEGQDDYTEARMKRFLRTVRTNADRTLRTAIPKRQEFLQNAEKFAVKAVELMPELKDAKSERRKLFAQVLREFPEIQRTPDWPLKVVAAVHSLEWIKANVEAKAKSQANPPPKKREVPVTIPAPRAQPARTPAKAQPAEDANDVADKVLSGDKSARLSVIKGFVPKMK